MKKKIVTREKRIMKMFYEGHGKAKRNINFGTAEYEQPRLIRR